MDPPVHAAAVTIGTAALNHCAAILLASEMVYGKNTRAAGDGSSGWIDDGEEMPKIKRSRNCTGMRTVKSRCLRGGLNTLILIDMTMTVE